MGGGGGKVVRLFASGHRQAVFTKLTSLFVHGQKRHNKHVQFMRCTVL